MRDASNLNSRKFLLQVHRFCKDSFAGKYYDASPRKNSRGWPEDPPLTGQWSRTAEHLCEEGIKLSANGQHRAAAKGLERLLNLLHHSEYGRYEIVYADEFGIDYYVLVDFKRLLKAFFFSLKKSSTPKESARRGLVIARLSSWNDNPEVAAFLEKMREGE